MTATKIVFGVKCKRPAMTTEARDLGVLPAHPIWVKLDGRYDSEKEARDRAFEASKTWPDYFYQVFSEITIERPVLVAFKAGEQVL